MPGDIFKEINMALSRNAKIHLEAGLANPAAAEEIQELIDALQTSLNALLDELEARRDAAETVAQSADGTYENLKV